MIIGLFPNLFGSRKMTLPKIVDKDDGLFIDGYRVPFVLEDSVSYDDNVVTLSIICESYRDEKTEHYNEKQKERTATSYSFLDIS